MILDNNWHKVESIEMKLLEDGIILSELKCLKSLERVQPLVGCLEIAPVALTIERVNFSFNLISNAKFP